MLIAFNENIDSFNEVCELLIKNEVFFNSHREEYSIYAAIFHYNHKPKEYFTDNDWLRIEEFFKRTGPYEISLTSKNVVRFVYIDHESKGSYSFYYFGGDSIDALPYHSQGGDFFNELKDGWYWGHNN